MGYKGLLLASGGIDSPVAGYLMKQLNVDVIAIHFDNYPYATKRPLEKTRKLMKKINVKKLYVVPMGEYVQKELVHLYRRFQCIFCRRMMFRIAEKIAKKEKCDFLITGENLGQVASQTLTNLTTAMEAVNIAIMRPLLCNDKQETVDLAKKIGTYEASIEPGSCCNLVPQKPHTRAKLEKIKFEEKRINIKEIVSKAVKNTKIELLE